LFYLEIQTYASLGGYLLLCIFCIYGINFFSTEEDQNPIPDEFFSEKGITEAPPNFIQ
jgi:hypothetical protein